ncbi:hypothetical protein ACTODO_00513 [Schaalia dentiphila ATCC 17982]|nr:hypothetical protein ACTODO_00513 [Schaalia odontolytica ATCC 17982]
MRASRRGLIPAHAGKTPRRDQTASLAKAHPRSRGENETHTLTTAEMPGSSPLTRGKLRSVYLRTSATGLIPAHAGKT